jgi:hypothetical protein
MVINLLTQLAERHPGEADYQDTLAYACQRLANSRWDADRLAEAEHYFRQAIAHQERLAAAQA